MMLDSHGLGASGLLDLFGHFLLLSLLSIGGAITTAPDMHRYLAVERHWINDVDFTSSVAIAQAAPGPNVLFVAVLGWNVAGALGMLAALSGILLPSAMLAVAASRWGNARKEALVVRAFTHGMAPLTLGLLLATGWVLAEPSRSHPGAMALVAVTAVIAWRTRVAPIWLVAAGAVMGALGLA
jgi:chromate transporter